MEKAVHSRPVSKEDEAFSCSKKLRTEGFSISEDIEKFNLFTDCEYKLPLYLAEFALGNFNSNKKTKYEKVHVVETMKSLDVIGTTYLITFEASLRGSKSKNARTFQTNMFMSPSEPSTFLYTEIKIKFVRIKPSELDYSGEEVSEVKVSESDEEDPEEELSDESVKEDSEEVLSDQKDNEEKFSESDGKNTEEKELAESDEKDSAEKIAAIILKRSAEEKLARKNLNKKRSEMMISCCMVRIYYDPPACTLPRADLNELIYLSQLAICIYNMEAVTYYDNVHVLKATSSGCGRKTYNIIFEASLSDGNDVIFQTKISMFLPFPCQKVEIQSVKIKPSINTHFITNSLQVMPRDHSFRVMKN